MLFVCFLTLAGGLAYLTWGTFHWFWSLTLAGCSAGAMIGIAIQVGRHPGAMARKLSTLLEEGTPKDLVKTWITEHGLLDLEENAGLVGVPLLVAVSILMYYYLPWSPESILGHVARVAVYFVAAALLTIPFAEQLEKVRLGAAKSVREILSASSDPSYNLLAAELTGKDDRDKLIQEIQIQKTPGDPQMFVDTWIDKVTALGPEGFAAMRRHKDPRLRELAAVGLGRINECEPIRRLLDDKEIRVRRAAAIALTAAGWTPVDPAEKSRLELALAPPAAAAGQVGEPAQLPLVGLHACPKCGSSQTIPSRPGAGSKVAKFAKGSVLGAGVGMLLGAPQLGAAIGTGLANAEEALFDYFRCESCGNNWKIAKPA